MMEMHNKLNYSLCFVLLCLLGILQLGFSAQDQVIQMRSSRTTFGKPILGGLRNCKGNLNDGEIESLGRFAVLEHNKKENALLEFARVINAKGQVVAGMMYHLTLEAIDAGKKRVYEAKVWVKPWMNFKQLQEFKHTHDVPSFTTSDLGIKQDGLVLGWRILPTHDPVVHDAAHYAVQTIKQRSNSLNPYELLDIVLAKAKVIENSIKFDLLLKVRRGIKEEKFKVMLSKNIEGKFYLDHMEQDYS